MEHAVLDVSAGQERFPISINSCICRAGTLLHGLLPDVLRENGLFKYDAGPVPAAFPVQVFRVGSLYGRGYGLRVLQNVAAGSFIIAYWGTYKSLGSSRANYDGKYDMKIARLDAPNTLKDVANKVSWYSVNAESIGNAARWINHSEDPTLCNIAPRIMPLTDGARVYGQPLVGFFAKRDIEAGEELRWDYNGEDVDRIPTSGPTNVPLAAASKYWPSFGQSIVIKKRKSAPGGGETKSRSFELLQAVGGGYRRAYWYQRGGREHGEYLLCENIPFNRAEVAEADDSLVSDSDEEDDDEGGEGARRFWSQELEEEWLALFQGTSRPSALALAELNGMKVVTLSR